MKLAEVQETYTLSDDGYITSRGPFYLERRYVPHFWEKASTQRRYLVEADRAGNTWSVFSVTVEDRAEYPELEHVDRVGVRRDGKAITSWIRGWSYRP